jgi:hypothetical protein
VHPQEKTANQTGQHLGSDRPAQTNDGDVVNPEPASDATKGSSIQRLGNASRKRMLRSRCNPQTSTSHSAQWTSYDLLILL